MKGVIFKTIEAAANEHGSAMESRDHFKNGVSPKDHTSRGNVTKLML